MSQSADPAVEAYFAALPDEARRTLEAVRAVIRELVPEATERIAYQMPAFEYRGKGLAYYGAWKKHCALYGMDTSGLEDRPGEFEIKKGNILFPIGKPLGREVVEMLIERRIAAITGAAHLKKRRSDATG